MILYRNPRLARPKPEQAAQGENRELLRLLVIVSLLVVVTVLAIDRATAWLAPRLPFDLEVRLAESLSLGTFTDARSTQTRQETEKQRAITAALQQHVEKISRVLQLPADMPITVHYLDSDMVNAVATLGGHVMVFRGLLEKLRYAEELDAVLAHEIGHVQHRHVVRHLSRGVTTAVAIGLLGIRSASLNRWLLGDLQHLEQLAYGRKAEREADEIAILASERLYGHVEGVVSVFVLFEGLQRTSAPAWTQSHPLPAERAAQARAVTTGTDQPSRTALTPLVPPLRLVEKAVANAPFDQTRGNQRPAAPDRTGKSPTDL